MAVIDTRVPKTKEKMAAVRGLAKGGKWINGNGQNMTVAHIVTNDDGQVTAMESTTPDPVVSIG